ncbi:MAG: DnaA N-terminal domain-containing protein, partial [Anaerolineales bacterium]|nr:DnaA N-terminal domain-containing protein [Anaerolineales bacterium]
MNIEQTWNSVLEQLQTDMPRASFETWVRDTQALSYAGGVITVAVRNAYARDWLESRLVDTVNNVLNSANMRVNFVVAQEDVESVEVETDDSLQDEKQLNDDDVLEISPEAYDSAYEQIVRPDRAVYLPGYFRR